MRLKVTEEGGYHSALAGLGFNKGLTSHIDDLGKGWELEYPEAFKKVEKVGRRLAFHDGGHNKFLETMKVIIDVRAPRYMWQEIDTYRGEPDDSDGVSKNSESTMHTIHFSMLEQTDFEGPIEDVVLKEINKRVVAYQEHRDAITLMDLKNHLPEGFLQRRIVALNYKILRNMILQRKEHRLPVWQQFVGQLKEQVTHPELLPFD